MSLACSSHTGYICLVAVAFVSCEARCFRFIFVWCPLLPFCCVLCPLLPFRVVPVASVSFRMLFVASFSFRVVPAPNIVVKLLYLNDFGDFGGIFIKKRLIFEAQDGVTPAIDF